MRVYLEWGGCVCVGGCVRGCVNCAFNVLSPVVTSLRSMKEEVRNLHCECMGAVQAVSKLIHFGVSFCF